MSPSDAHLAMIRQLLDEGCTAREIGAALGRTRCSIIGIVHRHFTPIGIGFKRPEPKGRNRHTRAIVLNRLKERQDVTDTKNLTFGRLLRPTSKRLIELNTNDCRYPVQEVPGLQGRYLFCAAAVVPGRYYCAEHWKVCNQQPAHLRRKAS